MDERTTIFIKPMLSRRAVSKVKTSDVSCPCLHRNDIRRASFVGFLVLCAPCSNDITKVVTFELYLSVVTHCACGLRMSKMWEVR